MSEYQFHIEPRDLLFLRDARPMSVSDAGMGANWPRPDQIYNAFINAFHHRWPEHQAWEGHQHRENDHDQNQDSSFRFGGLKTIGPFPVDQRELFLPCPLDLSADDDGTLRPMALTAADGTDLPRPLKLSFASAKLGKAGPPQWISAADYAKYLAGESFKPTKAELYDTERNLGIAIDPETGTTVDGKLYQAEYLRFRPGVRMAVQVSCGIIGPDRRPVDVFAQISKEEGIPLILGGQQGMATASVVKHSFSLPQAKLELPASGPVMIRWTLLSPAVFPELTGLNAHPGGWLPSWIDPRSGKVMLPAGTVERQPGERRDAWRQRVKNAPKINATLAAARVGKPLAFSGWDLKTGPKPTMLAIPAGAAYIFECDSPENAKSLIKALDGNRRSTISGEKGFGIGICSTIKSTTQSK